MFKEIPVSKAALALRSKVQKVGINDAPYKTSYKLPNGKTISCPYYSVWSGILYRCFNSKLHLKRPTYKECTVEESWLSFTNFKTWMETQDWENKTIDKDILKWGNKHYGPDTCVFISPQLNNLLTLRRNHTGKYPLGVSKMMVKGHEYYIASCSFYGKQKRLGYFKTIEEAQQTYIDAKLKYIKELAKTESNPKVKQALLNMY